MFLGIPLSNNQRLFEIERRLLPRDDLLQCMFLSCGPSYYLIQSLCYGQVLTGILPYDGRKKVDVIARIKSGERPPRPTDPSQNQWLRDRVWNMITTCWSGKLEQRCELSVVYRTLSTLGWRRVPIVREGRLDTQNNSQFTIAERFPTSNRATATWKNPPMGHPLRTISARTGDRNRGAC
jgi:hypothetical protein